MSLKEDNRRAVVLYRIERAFTALAQAKLNQEINCLEVTVNRLYYAAYYAVSALLSLTRSLDKRTQILLIQLIVQAS